MICEPVREHALIGQGGVCQDERHVGKARGEVRQWIHPRHPAARVDQDRDARLLGDGEDRFGGRIPEPEGLRARVQLDAAGSSGQAALRFADRIVGRVQSAVRNDPPAAVGGPRQHAIVGAAIGRAAVRVVKGERARARTARSLVQKADQCLWAERLPILVAAEVRVGVDDGRVRMVAGRRAPRRTARTPQRTRTIASASVGASCDREPDADMRPPLVWLLGKRIGAA